MHFNNAEYDKAIEVYETLKAENPQKSSQYIRQINVILHHIGDVEEKSPEQNPPTEEERPPTSPEPLSVSGIERPNIPGIDPNEELKEQHAFNLYSEGNLDQAIAIYEYLAKKYPEKESYYQGQINVLKEQKQLSANGELRGLSQAVKPSKQYNYLAQWGLFYYSCLWYNSLQQHVHPLIEGGLG